MTFPAGPGEIGDAWLRDVLPRAAFVRCERIGVGYGLDGTLARIHLQREGRPASVVAKWCGAESGAVEIRFDRDVAPRLGIDLPRVLASFVEADRALLLFEDVAPARQGDALIGASSADAERVVEVAAAAHAAFWDATDDPAVAWLPRWGENGARHTKEAVERTPRFLEREGARLPYGARRLVESLPEDLPRAYASLARTPWTLLHGDLHLDNVLFRPDGAPVVLDWASASRGPAAVDVGRILVEGLSVEGRRAMEDHLLARYVEALARRSIRCAPRDLSAGLDDAATVFLSAAVRWAGAEAPPDPTSPRLVPIVENLVRNTAAFVADRRS